MRVARIWQEAQHLAFEIDAGGGWYYNSDLTTVYRKARDHAAGVTVEYRGKRYPALYTPRNSALINLFKISPECVDEEEQHLRTIISYQEKQRRRTEKPRAEGMKEQPYRYHKPCEKLGISRRTYYRRKQHGKL